MKQRGLCLGVLAAILLGGCLKTKGGSVIANMPLTRDLSGFRSMAVHFHPMKPELRAGLGKFRPIAMAQIQQARVVSTVFEAPSLSPAPRADVLLRIRIHKYVKSNAGFLVRGGFAKQASIIMAVDLMDVKTGTIISRGELGAWTFKNKSNEHTNNLAATRLVRFLRRDYDEVSGGASPEMAKVSQGGSVPSPAPSPAPAAASASPPGAPAAGGRACSKDTDCPGDEICDSRRCRLPGSAAAAAPRACTRDTDCAGNAVCQNERCASRPPARRPSPSPPARTPPPGCARDDDCPGKQVCEQGRCLPPADMSPAELRRRRDLARKTQIDARRAALEERRRQAAEARRAKQAALEEERRQAKEARRARQAARRTAREEKRRLTEERRQRAREARLTQKHCKGNRIYRKGRCLDPREIKALDAPRGHAPAGDGGSTESQGTCRYGDLAGCERSCARKHPESCHLLGAMYLRGKGVKSSPARARASFESACSKGHTASCGSLAFLLERGDGTARDLPRAASLHARACDAKNSYSCARLAAMLRRGRGVKQDLRRARKLFLVDCREGGKRGKRHSCVAFGRMALLGEGGPRDTALAKDAFSKACAAGPEGCANLGVMFCKGIGLAKSKALCQKFMRKACSGGHKPSCAGWFQD